MSEVRTLRVDDISVFYPNGTQAVKSLSLEVNPGEVFGLVGPNGAGKSSLLHAIAGLIRPKSGRIVCGGVDVTGDAQQAAHHICLMPDPLGVYLDLSAQEYLEFFGQAYGIARLALGSRVRRVADELGLGPWLAHEVETLSAGWQRRLALGRLLLSGAPILLLDEPAAGLDILARTELLTLVRRIAGEGRTVIVTSHILTELEELSDRFGVINQGAWVELTEGQTSFTKEELATTSVGRAWFFRCARAEEACALLGPDAAITGLDTLRVKFADEKEAARALARLVAQEFEVYEFRPEGSDLSTVTLSLLRGEGEKEKAPDAQ